MSSAAQKLLPMLIGSACLGVVLLFTALAVTWGMELRERRLLVPMKDAIQWVKLKDGPRVRVARNPADTAAPINAPTIVLLPGLAGSVDSWRFVEPKLRAFGPTFAYDRAGTGFSDGVATERDAQAISDELAAVLAAAGIKTPYVLVAHSIAGLAVRVHAADHPGAVKALVLLDPMTENEWSSISPAGVAADQEFMFTTAPRKMLEGYLGVARIKTTLKLLLGKPREKKTAAERRLAAVSRRGDHWREATREAEAVFTSFDQARAAHLPPEMPLGILSAGLPATGDVKIVQSLHENLAKAATKGQHQVLANADHSAMLEDPAHAAAVAAFAGQIIAGTTVPGVAH